MYLSHGIALHTLTKCLWIVTTDLISMKHNICCDFSYGKTMIEWYSFMHAQTVSAAIYPQLEFLYWMSTEKKCSVLPTCDSGLWWLSLLPLCMLVWIWTEVKRCYVFRAVNSAKSKLHWVTLELQFLSYFLSHATFYVNAVKKYLQQKTFFLDSLYC
jgi:hypothetical protein